MMSNQTKAILKAVKLGYTITKEGEPFSPSGKPLVAFARNRGSRGKYRQFTLSIEDIEAGTAKISSAVRIHRMVAYLKFGEAAFEPGVKARHKDGNSLNNAWDNIILGTQSDNMMDRPEEDRIAHAKHAAKSRRKLTDADAKNIRAMRADGATLKEICAKYRIAKSTASYVVNKKTYA